MDSISYIDMIKGNFKGDTITSKINNENLYCYEDTFKVINIISNNNKIAYMYYFKKPTLLICMDNYSTNTAKHKNSIVKIFKHEYPNASIITVKDIEKEYYKIIKLEDN